MDIAATQPGLAGLRLRSRDFQSPLAEYVLAATQPGLAGLRLRSRDFQSPLAIADRTRHATAVVRP